MPIYFQKLQHYLELITFWQTKFNLISKTSVAHIWERHILDSLQLLKFINPNAGYNLNTLNKALVNATPIFASNPNLQTVSQEKALNNPTCTTKPISNVPKHSIPTSVNSTTLTKLYPNNIATKATPDPNNTGALRGNLKTTTPTPSIYPDDALGYTPPTPLTPPSGQIIFDLGSGAGFPSIVLAIMDSQNTYYAIESNSKKCVFLQYVKRELQLDNFIVLNTRIEDFITQRFVAPKQPTPSTSKATDVVTNLQNQKAHIVVSRALTSLTTLLQYTEKLLLPKGYGVFPKGASWQQELNDLPVQQQKLFSIKPYNNLFSKDGKIMVCQSQQ